MSGDGAPVEAQLAQIFGGVLRRHQRAGGDVEPVVKPRQQEADGCAARQQGQGRELLPCEGADLAVAIEEGAGLGDVEGAVGLKAPGVDEMTAS